MLRNVQIVARSLTQVRKAALALDAVEFVAYTDTLLTTCSCSASSDQPY